MKCRLGQARLDGLPAGFAELFASERHDAGGVQLHIVRGGDGPPVLLIPGWPQSWFAWRHVMPTLMYRGHAVVAVDPKGVGLSDAPAGGALGEGYDTGTTAAELVALMRGLGHERFDVVAHDVGMWIGYAIAADFPDAVTRLAVADALIPGLDPQPPLWSPAPINDLLWHFGFNRAPEGILRRLLDYGGARAYHDWQFATKASTPQAVPREAVDEYWRANSHDAQLHAALNYCRATDETSAQNRRRAERRLDMPVLAIGGALAVGEVVGQTMRAVAADVRSIVMPGSGHYLMDEDPEAFLHALLPFLSRQEALPLDGKHAVESADGIA